MALQRHNSALHTWRAFLICLFAVLLLVRGTVAHVVPHLSSTSGSTLHSHHTSARRQLLDTTNGFQFDSILPAVQFFPPSAVFFKLPLPETIAVAFRSTGCQYNRPPPAL